MAQKPTFFGEQSPSKIRKMAQEAGYEPGQFFLIRMAEDIATFTRWAEFLRDGEIPPELKTRDFETFREFMHKEALSLAERDVALLDYFYPKQRSVDTKLDASETLVDLLTKNGRASESG